MKNKELKNRLRQQANQIIIGDYQKEILSRVQPHEISSSNKQKKFGWLFVSLSTVMVSFVLIVSFFMTPSNPISPTLNISEAKEMMGYEIFALGTIMDNQSSLNALKKAKNEQTNEQEIAQDIHDYLLIGEMMLQQENMKIIYDYNQNSTYPYTYQLSVQYDDETSFQTNYTFYFNEEQKIKSHKDLDEVSTKFEGIMLKENQLYQVKGEKEVEQDEFDMWMIIYEDDANNFVKVFQETELKENELAYEFYENGEKVKELSLEVENKNFKKEMKIEMKEKENEKKFEFVYLSDKILCEYDWNGNNGKIEIYVFLDYYLYHFDTIDIQLKRQ